MALPNSRYANLGEATFVAPGGHVVVYLRRRLLPDPELSRGALVAVRPGERIDSIAARLRGSPAQFYRFCDANGVSDPMEVAEDALTQMYLPGTGGG